MPEIGKEFDGQANVADLEGTRNKFPFGILLDKEGNSTGTRVYLSEYGVMGFNTALYDADAHVGQVGCPCCLAPLKVIGGGYVQKGDYENPADPYYRSERLSDHVDRGCVMGQPDKAAEKRVLSILEYLSSDGEKILYWNFPYANNEHPEYCLYDHLGYSLQGPHKTAAQKGEKTHSVKNLKEFMSVFQHIDKDDPVLDRIDVVAGNCRFSVREILAGNDWGQAKELTAVRENFGLAYPSIASVELKNDDVEPQKIGSKYVFTSHTIDGIYQVKTPISVVTKSREVADLLSTGGSFALHGFLMSPDIDEPLLDGIELEDGAIVIGVNDIDDVVKTAVPLRAQMARETSYTNEEPDTYLDVLDELSRRLDNRRWDIN